jgi:hypothetical protein
MLTLVNLVSYLVCVPEIYYTFNHRDSQQQANFVIEGKQISFVEDSFKIKKWVMFFSNIATLFL